MQKIMILFCLVFLLCSIAAFAENSPTEPANNQIKIGVSIPLTGAQSFLGEGMRNAVILAKEELDRENRLQFIFEDDGFVAKNAVSAVNKLITADHINGLIIFGSSTSLAIGNLVEEHKIPTLALATTEKASEGKNYIVRHFLNPRIENQFVSDEVKRRKYESVAVLTTTQDGVLALHDMFLKNPPCKVVFDKEYNPDEKDFLTAVAQIKRLNPSAVYLLLLSPQGAIFAKHLRSAGYKGEFFSAHQLEDPAEVKLADGALLCMWYVNGDTRAASGFMQRYKARFGEDARNYGPGFYDMAKLMIEGTKTSDLNKYLHTVQNFEGSLGKYSATDNNAFALPHMLKVVTEKGFEGMR